jgi:GAF domain-containing protein
MTRIHRHDLGLSWVMDDAMERACHALRDDDGHVWLIDPARDDEALAAAAALGPAAGVIQLLDRHNRDCAALAAALEVPHLRVPEQDVDGAPFDVRRVVANPLWHEVALWWPQRRALVVAEALGTGRAFAVGSGPIGVHPLRRLLPPGMLRGLGAEHFLPGHGAPLHGPGVAAQVDEAIARSRHDLPRLVLRVPTLIRAAR